eukprot:symbB.v1.2.029056.t1/scaffold3142.1/size62523/1
MSMCQWKPELQWDNPSWRDLLASLDYVDAMRFRRVSLQEVVAFIIFHEKNPNDLGSWYHLSDDQLLSFKVEDPIAFLKSKPLWAPKIEKFAPTLTNKAKGYLEDMPDWMQAAWTAFEQHDCERVEESLLRPFRPLRLQMDHRTDLGQLFHGGASVGYKLWGEKWPRYFAFFDGLSEAHQGRLDLHHRAEVICGIVHTDWHWACFFYKLGTQKVLISDGLKNQQILDAVISVMHHIAQHPWFQRNPELASSPPDPMFMLVPMQEDTWSCGHRVILSMLAVLEHYKQHGELPDALSEDDISYELIKQLVQNLNIEDSEDASGEKVDSQQKVVETVVKRELSPSSKSPPRKSQRVTAQGTPEKPLDPVTPVPSRKRIRNVRQDAGENTPDDPKQPVQKKKKNEKKSRSEILKSVKARFQELGFDHNKNFQISHYREKKPPGAGHWDEFCLAFHNSNYVKCSICNQMLDGIWGGGQKQEEPIANSTSQSAEREDLVLTEDCEAPKNVVLTEDCGALKKPHRGRPNRREREGMMDIDAWVNTQRAGIYRRLNDFDSRHPFWCELCGVRVLAQRKHDQRYLLAHEQRERHKRLWKDKLKKEAGNVECLQLCPHDDDDDSLGPCKGACIEDESFAACKKDTLRDIAQWSFKLDLGKYAFFLQHRPHESKDALSQIQERDYQSQDVVKRSLEEVLRIESTVHRVRFIHKKLEGINHTRRNQALQTFLDQYVSSDHYLHANSTEQRSYSALVSAMTDRLAAGEVLTDDLKVASQIASGALRRDGLIMALMRSAIHMNHAQERGCLRTKTGQYLDHDALGDLMCSLGNSKETRHLLDRFGVVKSAIPRVGLIHPELPQFFCPLDATDPCTLQMNVRKSLAHLNVAGKRRHHIVVDETVVSGGYDVVYGLLPDSSNGIVIGGGWSEEDDWSKLDPQAHVLSKLPEDKKSKLYLDVVVTRNDNNNHAFHLCLVPQMPAKDTVSCSATKLLAWMGTLLREATKANGDLPPSSIAFDGGTKNSMLNKVLLGCIPRDDLLDYSFWHRLSFATVSAPMFPYKLCKVDGQHPLVGCNGPYHVAKRVSLQVLSGIRKVFWGSVGVCYASMLKGGLSLKAFACQDPQSDKQCAQRFNVAHACRDFDDFGVRLHSMIFGLCQSGWTSASAFTAEEQQKNLFSCFYLVLLNAMHQQGKNPQKWESKFLALQTIKNVLGLCGHGILGTLMDAGLADYRTEITIEKAFSEVKRNYRGMPNTKDCVLGTHLHHLRQLRSLQKKDASFDPLPPIQPISMQRTQVLASEALKAACKLQSLITLTPLTAAEFWRDWVWLGSIEEWEERLHQWYHQSGYKLCCPADKPEESFDWGMDCAEEEVLDVVDEDEKQQDLENVTRVEDRSEVKAQVIKENQMLEDGVIDQDIVGNQASG